MRLHRSLSIGLLGLAVLALAASACSSSSSPKATPEFKNGLTVGYTASGSPKPVLPDSFTNCVYGKLSTADQTAVSKVTTEDEANNVSDALTAHITQASNTCDPTLTQQVIEAQIFAGAPTSISATQKSCVTTKVIAAVDAAKDSTLTGKGGTTLKDAFTTAAASCGVSLGG